MKYLCDLRMFYINFASLTYVRTEVEERENIPLFLLKRTGHCRGWNMNPAMWLDRGKQNIYN